MIKERVVITLGWFSWFTCWWFLSIDISSWYLNPYRTLPWSLKARYLSKWFLIDWYPSFLSWSLTILIYPELKIISAYLNTISIHEAYLLNDTTPVPWRETIALSPVWHYPFILSISLTIFSCPSSDIWKPFGYPNRVKLCESWPWDLVPYFP